MDDLIREMLEPERPAPGMVARRRRLTATTAIIGLAAIGVTSLTTNALFTSEDSSTQTGFTTGTIVIETPEVVAWAVTTPDPANAAPGDNFFINVPISNKGTLEMRYAVELQAEATPAGSPLLASLDYEMYVPESNGALACTEAWTGPRTPLTAGSLNVNYADGWIKAVGDAATGDNDGDRVLGVNGSETLCLKVLFDKEADNDVQGHKATFNLKFLAEQTANN